MTSEEHSHSLARGYPSSVTPSERQNGIKAVQFGKGCIRSFDSLFLVIMTGENFDTITIKKQPILLWPSTQALFDA